MSSVKLSAETLKVLAGLIKNPSQALPDALKTLDPSGPWHLLTQKVGSNLAKTGEAELALPLLDKSVAKDGSLSTDWTWNASIEANAALAVDLLTEEDLEALPVKPDAGHTLIVYGASISAGGTLGANADHLPWGKVGASAGGKRGADMRWYIQAADSVTLLAALEAAQNHFVWPHDLQGMLRQALRTDWFGMAYELDGEAQLAIDVDASLQGPGVTFSLNGDTSTVGLSFGLKAGFKAARKSRWKLSAMVEPRALPGGAAVLGLRVQLHDLKQNSSSGSVAFTAGADFSAVAASAERALRAAWPAVERSELLDALTQPGTVVADDLRGLIDQELDGSLKPLAAVLAGGKPSADLRAGLVDKITFGLADVLDGALGKIADEKADLHQVATAWLHQLLGPAAVSVKVDEKIQALVSKSLDQATDRLQQAIESLRKQIVGKAQTQIDAVLKGLGELGAQFDDKLTDLNDNGVSAAITKALKQYADRRDKLLGVLADSHRQKLTLALAAASALETGSEAAFDVWFRPDDSVTPEAQALFDALYAGQLLTLPELVRAAAARGAIADAKGWLLSTSKTLQEQRVTLNFFGVEIGSRSTWLRDVAVKTDLVTGDLLAVNAGLSGETAIFNPWKNRTARLGLRLDLSGERAASRQLAVSLDGAFTAKQENTNRQKVQDLLNAYADATGTQQSDISQFLELPPASDSDGLRRFWKSLTIAVPVALDGRQWASFAAMDAAQIERVSTEVALAQFQRRYVADSLFSKDPVGDLRRLVVSVRDLKKADNVDVLSYLKLFPERHVGAFSAADAARKVGIEASDSTLHSPGARRFLAYHRLSATIQAPLRLRDLAAEASRVVQSLPAHPDPVAVRQLLEPIMARMQDALAPVALVSETWLGLGLLGAKDEPVAWPFVSFVTTMARLAGLPVPPGFAPIAQVGNGSPVRLIAG